MKTNKEDYSFMIAFYLKDVLLPGEQLKDSKSNTIILLLLCDIGQSDKYVHVCPWNCYVITKHDVERIIKTDMFMHRMSGSNCAENSI